ncbi:MAG: DUF4386 domain-containing protein [Vicinamibacteria bacterium]
MTPTANARVAGFTFLAYIGAGLTSMVISGRATSGVGMAEKLATIAQHTTDVGAIVLLGLIQCFAALVLGVTLYAITREQDRDLAMLGLICRVGEGLIGSLSIPGMLALLWLATATGTKAPDAAAAHALAAYLLRGDVAFTATFFAAGSTLFSYLLLRGRMIPVPLAWLGVAASVLLLVCLPLQLAGFLGGPITSFIWLPMLAFEVPLGLWLLFKGVAMPAGAPSTVRGKEA